jgi:hypothetical protein
MMSIIRGLTEIDRYFLLEFDRNELPCSKLRGIKNSEGIRNNVPTGNHLHTPQDFRVAEEYRCETRPIWPIRLWGDVSAVKKRT